MTDSDTKNLRIDTDTVISEYGPMTFDEISKKKKRKHLKSLPL